MNAILFTLLLATGAVWGLLTILRLRRRRYLAANRTRVIKESLERARVKQSKHPRSSDRPGPRPGGLK